MTEFLLVADRAASRLKELLGLARTVTTAFPADHLIEQNMMVWAAKDLVGLWLVFDAADERDRGRLEGLAKEYDLQVTEVTALPEAERRALREDYLFGTDYRFRGATNAKVAFAFFKRRLREAQPHPPTLLPLHRVPP